MEYSSLPKKMIISIHIIFTCCDCVECLIVVRIFFFCCDCLVCLVFLRENFVLATLLSWVCGSGCKKKVRRSSNWFVAIEHSHGQFPMCRCFSYYPSIGLRENLQETNIFDGI